MEDKYRKLLGASKNQDSAIALFPTTWNYQEVVSVPVRTPPSKTENQVETNKLTEKNEHNTVTEKAAILDSLSLFGEEKTKKENTYNFSGGAIEKKEIQLEHQFDELLTFDSWKNALAHKFQNFGHFDLKLFLKEKPIVVFVSDTPVDNLDNDRPELIDLDYYFEANVSDLFHKMIGAMRLSSAQYYMTSLKNNYADETFLLKELVYMKPQLVITLGAQATNFLLKSNMRLKDCHGKIHSIKIDANQELVNFSVMPLFSPHLLYSAPNMKKLAWKDMQTAMDYLNI